MTTTCRAHRVAGWRLLVFALVTSIASFGHADPALVPPELQAELLSKACAYDRNFAARAGTLARIFIVVRSGSARSEASAAYMKSTLDKLDRFAGLPHEEAVVPYESADGLSTRCRKDRPAVVYVTPGLDDEVEAIRTKLSGVDVLTVSAVPAYVEEGIVLGFELLSGRPKLLLNFTQAKSQHIDFPANVLILMKIVAR